MITMTDHFTSIVKKDMLQNTVSGIVELHQLKMKSTHDIANGKPPLNYDKYITLVFSVAFSNDTKRGMRKVQHTHIFHYLDQDDINQHKYFNVLLCLRSV